MQELRIVGTAIRADLELNELPQLLADEAPDLIVYGWRPIPGVIMGAAFDWVAILGTTADILGVGAALWAAYEHLVKKRKKLGDDKPPAFLIQIKTDERTFRQIIIGEGVEKEQFIQEFSQTVSTLRVSSENEQTQSFTDLYESSKSHVRVRPKRES